MDSNVKISIGIPIYNAEQFLEFAIKSVLNQSFSNYELILSDDGSDDRSLEIIRSFSDPRIIVLSDGFNKGVGYRLNEQINLAKGKYFARMDADDIMFPNRIAEQINFLESNPGIDAIGGWAVVIDDENEIVGLRKPNLPKKFSQVLQKVIFIHPTVMGKTDWYRAYLYDPELSGSEDYDLWVRSFNESHFEIIEKPILFYRDPIKLRLSTFIFRQKQIRRSLKHNYKLINKKGLILKLSFITICKSIIYTLFAGIKLDRILIQNRNHLLTESENKLYKDQLSIIINKNRNKEISFHMVSVIIPTHKRANYIQQALKTVISQSFKNLEIIVVDDNGINSIEQIKTEQKVNEFIEVNPNYCIRYFALEQNSGACFARNFGASMSYCTYLSFLDDDDKWDNRKLEKQYLILELNQLSSFCFCNQILEIKGEAKHFKNCFYFGNISNKILQGNYIGSSSNPLINKKYFDAICGFDINLPSCQDWDLWIRLMELATPVYLNKSFVIIDRNLTERISSNNLKVLLGHILLYSKVKTKYKKYKFSLLILKLKILKRVFKVLF